MITDSIKYMEGNFLNSTDVGKLISEEAERLTMKARRSYRFRNFASVRAKTLSVP